MWGGRRQNCELEDRTTDSFESEEQKEKRLKNEQNLRDP